MSRRTAFASPIVASVKQPEYLSSAGVSSSSGEVPTSFEQMGRNAVAFIKALGLQQVDVLGFSIGGFVAQEITLADPQLVRRLILLGTGPRSGVGWEGARPKGTGSSEATIRRRM